MEGKRLDLDAPLLSIRRITARADREEAAPPSLLRRKARPFFNDGMNSGLVGRPGTVPFVWETAPGQPKNSSVGITNVFLNPAAPKLPPGRSMKENEEDWLKHASTAPGSEMVFQNPTSVTCSLDGLIEKAKVEEEEVPFTECVDEDDAFSDARDAFSCAESFSMKCSTSAGVRDHSKSSSSDPQFKDIMMDRFLPAAHAMAAGSLQRTWRKPPRSPVVHCDNSIDQIVKNRLPLDYQYKLIRNRLHGTLQEKEDVEEEYDGDEGYTDSGFFSGNACGLIQRLCLKNSFCKLNRDPCMKAQRKPMPRTHNRHGPQTKVLCHASLGQTKDEDSWEAVYMYKLSHGYYPQKGEERKLVESNQLTSWSDSQMLDGSSFCNSTGSALSPDKHEDPKRESWSWRGGSSGSCERDSGCYSETTFSHGRLQGSGSVSPANKGHFNQGSFHLQEIPDNKSSENMPSDTNTIIESSGNSSALEAGFQQTEESIVSETSKCCTLQPRPSKIAEPGFSSCCERMNGVEVDGNVLNNNNDADNGLALKVSLSEKNDNSLLLSPLPPPLPTSPSESWLQRTLPYVSSKGLHTHQRSFLGIQFHPNKKLSRTSACDHK